MGNAPREQKRVEFGTDEHDEGNQEHPDEQRDTNGQRTVNQTIFCEALDVPPEQ